MSRPLRIAQVAPPSERVPPLAYGGTERIVHGLVVELVGTNANRDALGAIVEIGTASGIQSCFHTERPSLGAGGESSCHFGLGRDDRIAWLRIRWPDGSLTEPGPPAADRRVVYVQ